MQKAMENIVKLVHGGGVEIDEGTQIHKKSGLMGIAAHGTVLSCQYLSYPFQSTPPQKYFEQNKV